MRDKITWISSKHEAKYWWDELGNFQIECWEAVKDKYSLDTLKMFIIEVDELAQKYKLGLIAQAIVGATLIRRFLFSRYPSISPKLSKKYDVEELRAWDEIERSRRLRK